jgi:hypothetical protein
MWPPHHVALSGGSRQSLVDREGGISRTMVSYCIGQGSSQSITWGLLRGTNGPPTARESGALCHMALKARSRQRLVGKGGVSEATASHCIG